MRELIFYLGKLGSGKSCLAKREYKTCLQMGMNIGYLEISELVKEFFINLTGQSKPTRNDLQLVKERMKGDRNWLLNIIIERIESMSCQRIIISGLREKWILEELEKKYGSGEIFIINANKELRRKRRGLTVKEFEESEERDNKIGLEELLSSIEDRATTIVNNYEMLI